VVESVTQTLSLRTRETQLTTTLRTFVFYTGTFPVISLLFAILGLDLLVLKKFTPLYPSALQLC